MSNTTIVTSVPTVKPGLLTATSIGYKIWMALSGLILVGFIIGHMAGNLQIFLGQNQLNTYAQALKDMATLVWVVRIVMLTVVILHIIIGFTLWLRKRAARPIRYAVNNTVQAPLASRTMIWSGLGVLVYVIYHLLHYTFIITNPQYAGLHDAMGRHDVYSMVIMGYQNVYISAAYIVAMFLVAYHLSHAIESLFQTLGLNNDRQRPRFRKIAIIIATLIFLGYTSIPVAVLLGLVTLPGGVH